MGFTTTLTILTTDLLIDDLTLVPVTRAPDQLLTTIATSNETTNETTN